MSSWSSVGFFASSNAAVEDDKVLPGANDDVSDCLNQPSKLTRFRAFPLYSFFQYAQQAAVR
jgi:hypothetical protein